MDSLFKKLLLLIFIFAAMVGIGHAYTPVTWVNYFPNNLFTPPCLVYAQNEEKTCSSWQGQVRTNLVAVGAFVGSCGGLAVQGELRCTKLLPELYGQIYIPAIIEGYREKGQRSQSLVATIADIPLVIGVSAITRKSFKLDGYVLGIIPTERVCAVDRHFVWGLGSSCFVRIYGNPEEHLDLLTEADVIFHASHFLPDQYWKIQSALAFRVEHFIGDVGWQYGGYLNLFSDFGLLMQCGHLPSHLTVGIGLTAVKEGVNPFINAKFGVDF